MSIHLHQDLERLEKSLLYLAAQVEDAVRKALGAVLERRPDLAEEVIRGDRMIDEREVEIEEECLKLLALHHPVATDLRFLAAVLKIDNDLERVGDLAVNIAKRARTLCQSTPFPVPAEMRPMMEASMGMLREALDAFVSGDLSVAHGVCAKDDAIDDLHKKIARQVVEQMESNSDAVAPGMLIWSVSKALERIADHATNIAEDVVYMVDGEIIRHGRGGEQPVRENA
ncbi:MAG: phosphate signaling complex protein PhoU [Planctomycetota bacterium]|jgi:phosphate transport system protein